VLDASEIDEGIMSGVHAHDIFSLLVERLEPIDRIILGALAKGQRSREVAARLHISHESVRRHRHKIAAAALKLGIVPPAALPDAP